MKEIKVNLWFVLLLVVALALVGGAASAQVTIQLNEDGVGYYNSTPLAFTDHFGDPSYPSFQLAYHLPAGIFVNGGIVGLTETDNPTIISDELLFTDGNNSTDIYFWSNGGGTSRADRGGQPWQYGFLGPEIQVPEDSPYTPNYTQPGGWFGIAYTYSAVSDEGGIDDPMVPEPSASTFFGIGAISLLAYGWRRQRLTV
jgi:hypothetical protein